MAIPESESSSLQEAFRRFLEAFPKYSETAAIDTLRQRDFSRLDRDHHVYLDYTGGGLYGESQIHCHMKMLSEAVLGNPHSTNPTSLGATDRVEGCRRRILQFFNGSEDEYAVIFTANASQGLKLVGESYPFEPGDQFLLTFDNHNSVNGIREFDRAHGAKTTYIPVSPPDMRIDPEVIGSYLDLASPGKHNLFAYPAQSNFSGVQHPLTWIEQAQQKGWDVLLDAAAFVPTNRLDLGVYKPDYLVLSFYKMFGYPTGLGALIARRTALKKLHRPWFAGGTIEVASVQADQHFLAAGPAAFEDGTLDYANIPAVEVGLDFLESTGLETIHNRVECLVGWLLAELLELRHTNGQPLIELYGPASTEHRGGTVTLNFYDSAGRVIDHDDIEAAANHEMISLRTGCFCNPGAGEMALGISKQELVTCFSGSGRRMTYDSFRLCIDGKSTGAVRVSAGLVSNFEDVYRFVEFARKFLAPSRPD
jgi:selenocysteine lyase/cysteine desulfurase